MTKKLLFTLGFYLFSIAPISAQCGWYKVIDVPWSDNEPWGFAVYKDHCYTSVLYCCDAGITGHRYILCKINNDGELVWGSKTVIPGGVPDYISLQTHDIVVSKDESVYYISRGSDLSGLIVTFINKFDKNGNLCWMKEYPVAGIRVGDTYKGAVLSADSLGIIFSSRFIDSPDYRLTEIDSAGNIVRDKMLDVESNTNKVSHVMPITRMPDNSIRFAYDNYHSSAPQDYWVATDSALQLVQTYVNPLTSKTKDIQRHPNGNLVYLAKEDSWSLTDHQGMRIQMMTPDFDTLWSYLHYDYELPGIFIAGARVDLLSIHPDGRILASGSGGPLNTHLVCLSPEGQLLWKRKIFFSELLPGHSDQSFHIARWSSDGCIFLIGRTRGQGEERTVLIKLDSVGCAEPNCISTTFTSPTEEVVLEHLDGGWVVAPNPADAEVLISRSGSNNGPGLDRISVFDANGHTVWEQNYDNAEQVRLACGSWANGSYFVQGRIKKPHSFIGKGACAAPVGCRANMRQRRLWVG